MSRVCGGVAAAVLFCWFESLFVSGQHKPGMVSKPSLEWQSSAGMRQPYFSRAFNRIGVVYMGPGDYAAAKLAGREFWSDRRQRHLFYSMELTHNSTIAVLRRNAFEIERALGASDHKPEILAYQGSKQTANMQAKDLARKLAL